MKGKRSKTNQANNPGMSIKRKRQNTQYCIAQKGKKTQNPKYEQKSRPVCVPYKSSRS